MEQANLFNDQSRLSSYDIKLIVESMKALSEWGAHESIPYIKDLVLDYFNQLKILIEKYGDYED